MRPPPRILIAARLLLGHTQAEVAKQSAIGSRTIFKLEKGTGDLRTVERLVSYYEGRGIEFFAPAGDRGWGVFSHKLTSSFDDERERVLKERLAKSTKAESA